MSRTRRLSPVLCAVVAMVFVLGFVSPAGAATTRTVSGTVTCTKGGEVVGVWVSSSAGGSRFATFSKDSAFKYHATFSAAITTSASSTRIHLNVGCGGSTSAWGSENSTPDVTVTGNKGLYTDCAEASGARAVRCSWIPAPPSSTVLTRAKSWVDARVPYSQTSYYRNQYGSFRQDCSGYVSMAWSLSSSYTTSSLTSVATKINKADLRPGDILLKTSEPGHAIIFVKWTSSSKTSYYGWEANGYYGRTLQTTHPYPYIPEGGTGWVPYRKK